MEVATSLPPFIHTRVRAALGDGPAFGAGGGRRESAAAQASSYQSAVSAGGLAVSPHHFL
jgi:hypothetical protein